MQLNIKKYESANIYVLLQDNIIIGIYTTINDANIAKQLVQNKHKHKESNSWIIL
jgi:hypothetical protein